MSHAHFSSMPWTALPHNETIDDRTQALMSRFDILTTPALIMLNSNGSIICRDGRDMVQGNRTAGQGAIHGSVPTTLPPAPTSGTTGPTKPRGTPPFFGAGHPTHPSRSAMTGSPRPRQSTLTASTGPAPTSRPTGLPTRQSRGLGSPAWDAWLAKPLAAQTSARPRPTSPAATATALREDVEMKITSGASLSDPPWLPARRRPTGLTSGVSGTGGERKSKRSAPPSPDHQHHGPPKKRAKSKPPFKPSVEQGKGAIQFSLPPGPQPARSAEHRAAIKRSAQTSYRLTPAQLALIAKGTTGYSPAPDPTPATPRTSVHVQALSLFSGSASKQLGQSPAPAAFVPHKLSVTAHGPHQGKPRSLMQPQPLADAHPFTPTMKEWRHGIKVDCGPDWTWDNIVAAVERGPHPTACTTDAYDLYERPKE
jgi:hypothetical protein